MEMIWNDKWPWWSYIIKFFLIMLSFIVLFFLKDWNYIMSTSIINKLSFFLLLGVALFNLSALVTHRLTTVITSGIFIGTVSRDDHMENPKLKLRKFLPWEEIKKIKIVKKNCKRSFGVMDFVSTLQVTPKVGKKYECYINDIPGFYDSLKSLGKSSLVARGSYSGPSTTDIPIKELKKANYAQIIFRVILGILIIIFIRELLQILNGT